MDKEIKVTIGFEVKQFEVRDAATFIPVLAVKLSGANGYLIRRAGFDSPMVYLIHLSAQKAFYDPYDWDTRTMAAAHIYIAEHFDALPDEFVVDVEFIWGLTKEQKKSERFTT